MHRINPDLQAAPRAITLLILAGVLVLGAWLASAGCAREDATAGDRQGTPNAGDVSSAPANGAEAQAEGGEAGEAAEVKEAEESAETAEAAEASDLDQSVELLLAKSCEHGIPMYTCDECRYEVGAVKVAPELLAPGGLLATTRAAVRSLGTGRMLNGEVALDAERAVSITPRVPGVVGSVLVDVGSAVRRGQALVVLDSPEISEARSAWRQARAASRLAEATAAREADLFDRLLCPKKDLLEAEATLDQARAEQKAAAARLAAFGIDTVSIEDSPDDDPAAVETRYTLRAPFAGRVLERNVSLGSSVEPGQALLLLGDTSRMWVLAQVYEREIAAIIEAQARGEVQAYVSVPAYPDRVFAGRVDRMSGVLDEATRTARIRIVVDNPEGLLRAGMFARAGLRAGGGAPLLAVPADAVLEDAGRAFVFVPTTAPYFLRRPVQPGRTSDGWTEIRQGLREGDIVVSRGAFQLKSDVLRSKMGAGCAD